MLTKTFEANDVHAFSDKYIYGSTIVHEANHSKQMQDYCNAHAIAFPPKKGEVPINVYSGEQAEMECLKVQREFLVTIGAPRNYLDWIDNSAKTKWWERNSR
jgi:hypothetical protein